MQNNVSERSFARGSTSSGSARPAGPRRLDRRIAGRLLPLLAAAAMGGAALLAPAPASAQSKIAVVDVRRAMLETEEGLRLQATLKKLFDSRQVELDSKQRALADERDKLDKEAQAGKTPKDALQRRFETWQRQAAELQATMVDYQREMQRKESELTTPILQKVLGLLRRLAAQEGYDLILDKAAAPYFRADLELTDRAIQLYNSGQGGDAPPAKGAAPAKGAPAAAPAKPASPAPRPATPAAPATPAKK